MGWVLMNEGVVRRIRGFDTSSLGSAGWGLAVGVLAITVRQVTRSNSASWGCILGSRASLDRLSHIHPDRAIAPGGPMERDACGCGSIVLVASAGYPGKKSNVRHLW